MHTDSIRINVSHNLILMKMTLVRVWVQEVS